MSKPIFKETSQNNYKQYWYNYFNFNGNSNRGQFWWPILWNALINFGLTIITMITILIAASYPGVPFTIGTGITILINILFSLATIIPNISNSIRRYHDVGISGWWFIPLAVIPTLIYFLDYNFNNTILSVIFAILILINLIILILPTKR